MLVLGLDRLTLELVEHIQFTNKSHRMTRGKLHPPPIFQLDNEIIKEGKSYDRTSTSKKHTWLTFLIGHTHTHI